MDPTGGAHRGPPSPQRPEQKRRQHVSTRIAALPQSVQSSCPECATVSAHSSKTEGTETNGGQSIHH